MRDPRRMDRILGKLRAAWAMAPDQRLGQLVYNVMRHEGRAMHSGDAELPACAVPLIEDDTLEKAIDAWIDREVEAATRRQSESFRSVVTTTKGERFPSPDKATAAKDGQS